MQFTKNAIFGAVAALGLGLAQSTSWALPVTFFDSGSFEAPASGSPLWSSFVAQPQWVAQHGATPNISPGHNATIKNAAALGFAPCDGNKALEVVRDQTTGNDQRYFYNQGIQNVVSAGLQFVTIEWCQRVAPPTNNLHNPPTSPQYGPFFGIESYGMTASSDSPLRQAAFGYDSRTGNAVYISGGTYVDGPALPYNTWHDFKMVLDYSTRKVDLSVTDGSTNITYNVASGLNWLEAFGSSPAVTRWGDADIAALRGQPQGTIMDGTAWFDDLKVTAVPEPTTLAGLAGVAVLTLRRRK
jgi:hypothetical protein